MERNYFERILDLPHQVVVFVWELLKMLIHSLLEVVGNSNRKFLLCWFTKTLS